ncbi:MAG: hypothetical protein J7497_17725, partial [Chitinophagaceae bacterium]|nr:hypothetical protein [Chitinophagaceae bacterium]
MIAKVLHFILALLLVSTITTHAQSLLNADSAFNEGIPGSGRLWGYVFGDYYYKSHADSLNRGGANQYTGIPEGRNTFHLRRIYLGYDYNLSKKFSAELLLAAEDNFPAYNASASNAPGGDLLANGKESFYIKLANIRWKNIWKGTDLILGQQATPAYVSMSEKIWNYRSVERTITDIHRTPSYDLGAGLRGTFDPATNNFGYNLLTATGNGARPANTSFKWFYGDIWAIFLNKKLIVDVYADYQRLNWQPGFHHDRHMLKGFIAYNTPIVTFGAEGFVNIIRQDTRALLNIP